jgi:hypothetical protein
MANITENLQTLKDIKGDIKTAIQEMGVNVGNTAFGGYADLIRQINNGEAAVEELTMEQYNALETVERDVLYLIKG